jgi:lysophospholipase L1-like esterase
MKDLAQALGVVLSILCMHSAGAERHYSSQTKRILVLGDSLPEGFGLRQSEAYPALLIDKLHAASLSFEVTNASASGGTTEGGLRRLPPHLKRKPIARETASASASNVK